MSRSDTIVSKHLTKPSAENAARRLNAQRLGYSSSGKGRFDYVARRTGNRWINRWKVVVR